MPIRRALALLSLLSLLLVMASPTWAQELLWAKRMGGTFDEARGVAVDASGNILTVGYFRGAVDFDPGPGTFELTPAGDDVFVSKLDGNGNFVWARQLGGTANEGVHGVAVDASDNVLTVGFFQGTADFDPGPGTFNLTSAGSTDAFVSKLDSNGDFLWAGRLGGPTDDFSFLGGVAVDASGNVYTVGYFRSTADFDPGPGTFNLTAAGSVDVFVSKLDDNGNFVWARQLGGTSDTLATGVAVDASGNVHTVGYFSGTVDFDPGPGSFDLTAVGYQVFVSKLNSLGSLVWAKKLGGPGGANAFSVALDAFGNVYTVGLFTDTADFDPGPGTFNLTAASQDIFVSKLDTNGNFVWVKRVGGTAIDVARGAAVDTGGNVHTVGYFNDTADFDPGPGTFNLTSAGEEDVFESKLDSNGDFLWAGQMGGATLTTPWGVAVDARGSVHIVGGFRGTADFDPGPGTFNLTATCCTEVFVAKLAFGAVASGDVADTLDVRLAGGGIRLEWGPSCSATDDDYAIYQGTIGNWYSHVALFCSTGTTHISFPLPPGHVYYLVVPRNVLREGSYGTASNGTPRPQGGNACAVQLIAQPCP